MSSQTLSSLESALSPRYSIEHELGQGGTATVYLAEDRKHNRRVAVKVFHPDLAAELGAERFLRERFMLLIDQANEKWEAFEA